MLLSLHRSRECLALVLIALASCVLHAQNVVTIDASGPPQPVLPLRMHLGANRSPAGDIVDANSQYLTLDGKPWLPVMGEFHFSRYPRAQWRTELEKMKAAGVSIVSTYVIWIHHEEIEGKFDWSGQRDLRAFVQLCQQEGLYVYPRIGPWAHAETRNGGLPDWVLANSPVRRNDPIYLREVNTFYQQIGDQLRGLLWKDGGPVIGLQLENEYHERGPLAGAEHLRTLKKMALSAGLDVPLYTVTGWDNAVIPLDTALPVFGGYPAAPWDASAKPLPPADVYAFRFNNRAAGSMGAIGGDGQGPASAYAGTPFLTAEVGGGIEDTYFRRPVLSADDVAAVVPVMLGSGTNLLGLYMFHGGRNPNGGRVTLEESQRNGDATDVPVRSYDFQAPIGEFGQERESLRKLKLVNYFLEDFGADLAPMQVHAPTVVPSNPSDLSVPRVSARTSVRSGFLFFNNHIRNAKAHGYAGFQVRLKLSGEELRVPAQPIELKPNVYGIWPVNFQLGATLLRYSTAQLFKRVVGGGRTYFVFAAISGVDPEFLFARGTQIDGASSGVAQQRIADGLRVRPNAAVVSRIDLRGNVSIVLLPAPMGEIAWRGDDPSLLVLSSAAAFSHGPQWTLEQTADPHFTMSIFAAGSIAEPESTPPLHCGVVSDLMRACEASVAPVNLPVRATLVRSAGPTTPRQMGPVLSWRKQPIPMAPDATAFQHAAVWSLNLPPLPQTPQLAGAMLQIDYEGDVARLYAGTQLLDDNFWNGLPWKIGLGDVGVNTSARSTLQLRILPLSQNFPMYIERAAQLQFNDGRAVALRSVKIQPVYRYRFAVRSNR